jgi:hypothetical protein
LRSFGSLLRLVNAPNPDMAGAQRLAVELTKSLVLHYKAGRMTGGQSPQTQALAEWTLNGLLCLGGLPPAFGPGSLGDDGSAAFIYPTTPDTTVVTGTEWAGVIVPSGSVTQPTIVTIQRLPDFPGPLATQFDQYPIYYEYHSTSATFTGDVVVGICVADNVVPPDPSRLRLAHNVAPGTIEVLPLAQAPFLDCSDAPIAAGPSRWGFDLARAKGWLERGAVALFLPGPVYAFGVGGVGGTVRTFSPFGAIDTLGIIAAASPIEVRAPNAGGIASPAPSVVLRTPTGVPMAAIPVTFTPAAGGGTVIGGSVPSDSATGSATVGQWNIGTAQRCSELGVSASSPPGTGFASSGFAAAKPFTFFGCANVFP